MLDMDEKYEYILYKPRITVPRPWQHVQKKKGSS
jgi:hypothetical protein